mmetsp:Transcript_48823/g.137471  ORF Transcript_48823/g.137471 Transcript_48823/m.137471 type:complete len:249 (-) Transcript_48823:5194-5940(-)
MQLDPGRCRQRVPPHSTAQRELSDVRALPPVGLLRHGGHVDGGVRRYRADEPPRDDLRDGRHPLRRPHPARAGRRSRHLRAGAERGDRAVPRQAHLGARAACAAPLPAGPAEARAPVLQLHLDTPGWRGRGGHPRRASGPAAPARGAAHHRRRANGHRLFRRPRPLDHQGDRLGARAARLRAGRRCDGRGRDRLEHVPDRARRHQDLLAQLPHHLLGAFERRLLWRVVPAAPEAARVQHQVRDLLRLL